MPRLVHPIWLSQKLFHDRPRLGLTEDKRVPLMVLDEESPKADLMTTFSLLSAEGGGALCSLCESWCYSWVSALYVDCHPSPQVLQPQC